MYGFLIKLARRAKKSVSDSAISFASSKSGTLHARLASWTSRLIFRNNTVFGFDPEAQRPFARDDLGKHYYTDPSRVKFYLGGLRRRGKQLHREYLLDYVSLSDGDTVIEAGAYDGDFGLALATTGKRLNLISFEPSPQNACTAELNINEREFGTAEVHQAALWCDDTDPLPFYLKVDSADSSLIEFGNHSNVIDVQTVKLETLLKNRRVKLLKLEAEGAEPEIVQGAGSAIRNVEFISADLGFERGREQASTLPAVANLLFQHGFEMSCIRKGRLVVLFQNTRSDWS